MPRLHEIARFTENPEATAAFYETLLDSEPSEEWDGGAIFDVDGVQLMVHLAHDGSDTDYVSFAVADVDAYTEQLADAGLDVEAEPEDYPWGRASYLRDPDGRRVELVEE